jgi:hypothetical protein
VVVSVGVVFFWLVGAGFGCGVFFLFWGCFITGGGLGLRRRGTDME